MPFDSTPRMTPFGERDLLAGNIGPDRREHALHAGARVGRAAHDLQRLAAGVDHADAQPVGVGVLFGLDDARDDETPAAARRVLHAFDLEADAGQRLDDLGERGLGVEVVFEPGEGEFHGSGSFPGFRDETDRSVSDACREFGRQQLNRFFGQFDRLQRLAARVRLRRLRTSSDSGGLGIVVGPFARASAAR